MVPALDKSGTVDPSGLPRSESTVSYLQFLQSIEKAIAVRTLESLARIELGAQGGALLERVTTTRISKSGVATTTVRERFTVACVSLEVLDASVVESILQQSPAVAFVLNVPRQSVIRGACKPRR